jgi:hypothetical protein
METRMSELASLKDINPFLLSSQPRPGLNLTEMPVKPGVAKDWRRRNLSLF